ncbi:Mu-like prophage DNA circulation protein [Commensalibacter communis]|uniref:Mu-like prophage DNA circulation protein n=1 Tax=Commensalibacter communis TaxID=2972786 RepID=A0A9W4X7I6_9PROT|nr:DNA circularization N-terminal domain-containing protein [Commensalibacter communis]CAI3953419.1 Mu-like prophage DNA circulation protein [Commensalibacter communis]CAI3956485.1 Mu-like prophage DNA circulation protein [Commensalibacter communis]CAI3956764.1 Mu-like prophage DNA circulation protein [Commensalibacter communis]CAI3957171.1 Mu-like prophage DNA circulation protein [Commensalibacter communis]
MRKASFRGVSFWVNSNSGENGRKTAIHEYPNKDQVWIEDLGRAQRRYHIRGFVLGSDVVTQRQLMLNAVEQEGPGNLIHPTLGMLKVSVTGNLTWNEPDNIQNKVEFNFDCVEYSNPVAGFITELTGSVIGELSDTLSDTAIGDFLKDTAQPLKLGMMDKAVSIASDWGAQALLQGTGAIPIAALGNVLTTQMGDALLNLATNRENLSKAIQVIDPNFETSKVYQ